MADYFAECEEHLAEIRTNLLALEQGIGTGRIQRPVLDDLFRNFHSLKGISAIAELRAGERLAHEMESYLRALRSGEVALTVPGLDALVGGTAAFEQVVAARRAGQPLPSIDERLRELAAIASRGGVVASDPHVPPDATRRWKVTFTPSAALIAREVKVDAIRERLLRIGRIEHVAPRVLDEGRIAFEFLLATDDEASLAAWHDDGVRYEAAAAADVAPTAAAGPPDRAIPREGDTPVAAVTNFVRVDLARLDDLMRHVADMVVTRSRMEDTLARVEPSVPPAEWRSLVEHSERLERQLRDLREGVMRVRLVPVGEIFRRMPFVVRDLARDSAKRVRVELSGQATEIDKFLIERMLDPVLHLVRNAVSHGIELPEERVAAGKPPDGAIRLGATTVGESVILEISDDGRGLDRDRIVAVARSAGLDVPIDAAVDERLLLDMITTPGFSTRERADRASGRGVGMAVVRDTVQELGGTLEVDTTPGEGTTFRITLPLTLAITDALLVTVGGHTFAVPQASVREVTEAESDSITAFEGNELMVYRGGSLPMVRLSRVFGIPDGGRYRMHALVIGTGMAAVGILVDRIVGQREVVVKTLADPLVKVDTVSGVTELGDGRVVLILDVAWIAKQWRTRAAGLRPVAAQGRT
jgi:two-component system chemotaxis sensor kinase CheA